MKTKTAAGLLLHPVFLLSLLLLILNDFYFKAAYHNAFTGKLSDVTGLFAFAVFLIALLPVPRRNILIGVALFFTWWKSPLSGPLIDFFNLHSPMPVGRVADSSDLLALAVLPATLLIRPMNVTPVLWKRLASLAVAAVCLFSFSATSMVRRLTSDKRIIIYKSLRARQKPEEVTQILKKEQLDPRPIEAIYFDYDGSSLFVRNDSAGASRYVTVDSVVSQLYTREGVGHSWLIPQFLVGKDTVYNLQYILTENPNRSSFLLLRTFEYRLPPASDTLGIMEHYQLEVQSYSLSRRLGPEIRKKMKAILKKNRR